WEKYSKPIVHPMVRTHPVHGSRAVFFHITKTLNIEGMSEEASRAYLNDLLDRMIRPEIVYTHQWRKGDVLIIDDRATMHRAHGDYDRQESRVLWRIIVEGDRPRLTNTRVTACARRAGGASLAPPARAGTATASAGSSGDPASFPR